MVARWLRIYLSMASFVLVLFFAAAGLTLNHPDWFADHSRTIERNGVMSRAVLHSPEAGGVDKLALVEFFRQREHIHGALTDFSVDEAQVSMSFRAPGYTADAFVDKETGRYELTEVQNGVVAVMNDLHKGRDAGKAWSVVIDLSAIVLVLVSVTGLVLIWFVYKRRTSGLLLMGVVGVVAWLLFKISVQ